MHVIWICNLPSQESVMPLGPFCKMVSMWILMNKMLQWANMISWRAINFKVYVAKWKKTKLHIWLMKNKTRSSTRIVTIITLSFLQSSSGRCCCHSRQLLMSTILTSQSGERTLDVWCGQLCRRYISIYSISVLDLSSEPTPTTSSFQCHYYFRAACSIDIVVMVLYGPC